MIKDERKAEVAGSNPVGPNMKIKVIASIAVENDGKFLILKRSPHDTMPNLWEFPGGKIIVGEKIEDSARRELLEETGIEATELEYKGYTERFSEDREFYSGYHTIVHHFYAKRFKGNVKLSEEHSSFKWLTKDEILKMKVGEEIGSDTAAFFDLKFKST